METTWYVATLIMRCRVNGDETGPWTCDEQIRLLQASDEETAYQKALALGKDEEHAYANTYDQTVSWEFVGLAGLDEVLDQSLHDGCEIRSRLFTDPDPTHLIHVEHPSEYETVSE
jgi:hypothetical protein